MHTSPKRCKKRQFLRPRRIELLTIASVSSFFSTKSVMSPLMCPTSNHTQILILNLMHLLHSFSSKCKCSNTIISFLCSTRSVVALVTSTCIRTHHYQTYRIAITTHLHSVSVYRYNAFCKESTIPSYPSVIIY
ncbi:unnamed protein product [Albugo candida]|uniref:Uncharacterized protein n=1 Tax=Albugo candida TaxID=65357 RepID=A0A024GQP0_9STRA|nr:unnamed protein product [Albugo candida]|eukprot:CCI49220.1 unnamed protein product [Albugo candida]